MKNDIHNRDDVIELVDAFYKLVLTDEMLSPIFKSALGNKLAEHMPTMYNFWSSILLREQSYTGNVMLKHIALHKQLSLKQAHFDKWVELWTSTTSQLFEGPISKEAIKRAQLMKELMIIKIKQSENPGFIQ